MGKAILILFCLCYCVATTFQHETLDEENDPFFGFTWKPKPKRPLCKIPGECKVEITTPHKGCRNLRLKDIIRARYWYKITNGSSTIQFPLANQIPWLDETIPNIKYYYAIDPFESRYLILLSTWIKAAQETVAAALVKAFVAFPFVTNKEYVVLHDAWNAAISKLQAPQYFGNPTQYPDFTDHFDSEYWKTDEAFVQRRLAGECPYLIKKVLNEDGNGINFAKLKEVINYDVVKTIQLSISSSKKISIMEAIVEKRLFVLYLPDMNDVKTSPDLLENPTDTLLMRSIKSQITLFILKDDGELAVAAIQTDSKKDSKVLTPASDANEWQIAKSEVELTAHSFCQAKLHLGGIHWVTTVYCLTFRRHLSTKHPLYDFFKYHCEGTIPHISTAYTVLTDPKKSGNLFYTMGNAGFLKLSKEEYDERDYETFTLENFIKGQGLDDSRIKYYPFRDDAQIILKEYEDFADELVNVYYRGLYWRERIGKDDELQSWVNELSAHGVGKGKMIGFPPRFTRNHQLKTFIKRFLWYNLFHASVNYALEPDFLPLSPTKLYKSTTSTPSNIFQSLLGGKFAVGITVARGTLGSFRANRIFEYFTQLPNPKLRRIVRKYYYRLHRCVQKTLSKRNADRKSKNQLGYQFIEPKWLTNSIHI